MDFDVIVIGAGLSGLSAAKCLDESGIKVIVLEAMNRVGGRTYTKKGKEMNYVDLGGSYVGPTQDRILRIAKEFGIETYKVNDEGDHLLYANERRIRYPFNKSPRRRNPLVSMDINEIMRLIDKMGEEIPADAPWKAPKAEEWDIMTFKEFLQKHCWTKACLEYFKNVTNINLAAEPFEVSLLCHLWYIKQCGGTTRISSTTNGAQERKFIGGSQQISEKIAEKLGSNRVLINNPVIEIDQESKHIIRVKTLNGKEFQTKYVILACPPALQMKIHFKPSLPPIRNQLMQRMPMGTVMKVIVYYQHTFWRDKGLCGDFLIVGDDNHPAFAILDDTKPDGSYPALIGFVAADKCRRFFTLSPREREILFCESLAEAICCQEALKPIHYEEKNWMEEHYIGGCYTTLYPPGFFTRYGKIIRDPIDRLYFAGTETATKWSGYMDGAIQAGERSAREILYDMGKIPKDQIWQEEPSSKDAPPIAFDVSFAEKYTPSITTLLKLLILMFILGIAIFAFLAYLKYWK